MKYDLKDPGDKAAFLHLFNYLLENEKQVELKECRKKRTIKQNAYLHVCITLFAIETGYTISEAKTILKRECSFMRYKKKEKTFLKQTSKLNTKELTDFIEFIRDFSAKNGLYIPTSEEYKEKSFEIDRKITNLRQFL